MHINRKEEKKIKDAIGEIIGYNWLHCAILASEVLNENYSKEISKSRTPIGLLSTLLDFRKKNPDKVTIKIYDFKTNTEVKTIE